MKPYGTSRRHGSSESPRHLCTAPPCRYCTTTTARSPLLPCLCPDPPPPSPPRTLRPSPQERKEGAGYGAEVENGTTTKQQKRIGSTGMGNGAPPATTHGPAAKVLNEGAECDVDMGDAAEAPEATAAAAGGVWPPRPRNWGLMTRGQRWNWNR